MKIDAFYKPESEITQKLIRRISQRRAQAMQQAVTGISPDIDDDSSESDELQRSIIAALDADVEDPTFDDTQDRRWLSEIVYHFWGRLAHQSQREKRSEFNLAECMVEGMRVRLGLNAAEDIPLLEELARDFSNWLVKFGNDGFVAGWGRIFLDSGKLCLEPLSKPAPLARYAGAGMRGAAQLDREMEASEH